MGGAGMRGVEGVGMTDLDLENTSKIITKSNSK
jgi:hypothetical protein